MHAPNIARPLFPRLASRGRTPALRADHCVRLRSRTTSSSLRQQNHSSSSSSRSASTKYESIEEHTLPRYYEKRYCGITIGQTLNSRYRILTKLGFGSSSTVWLARDQRTGQYRCIKAFVRDDTEGSPVQNELEVLRYISTCSKDHGGASLARLLESTFQHDGHSCLVMKPQACSLQQLQDMLPDRRVHAQYIRSVVLRMLGCVNWLQLDCGVVHTEITPRNIIMAAEDDTIFQRAESEEAGNPSEPWIDHSHPHPHPIYPSRGFPATIHEASGNSLLSDFGSAGLLKAGAATTGWWMPDTYRAPEVLMGVPWDHSVDIWCIGVMVLELLEGRNVFDPIDREHNQYVLPLALQQYISLLGRAPPLRMVQQSSNPVISTFFDERGNWIVEAPTATPEASLEDFVTKMPPGEEREQFLTFIRKILVWEPAERATSAELFEDEWLTGPFKAMGIL